MSDATLNIAGSGIRAAEAQYEGLVNNLVNAQTAGYKYTSAALRSFPEFLAEVESQQNQVPAAEMAKKPQMVSVERIYSDFSQGGLKPTNNQLDFGLEGEGFFTVLSNSGNVYTRDGRFTVNDEGVLITTVGNYPVVGEKGPIVIPAGGKIEVSYKGEILVDNNPVDSFKVTTFEKPGDLELAGGNFYRPPLGKDLPLKTESPYKVIQGSVEISNVNPADEMIKMIMLSRMHEGNITVAKARDGLLSTAVGLGKPIGQ
jgi:flagellar basal-body rod protein FlgF